LKYTNSVKYISLFIILVFYAGLSTTLFNLKDIPFDSDEATHALEGMRIATAIYHIDIASFLNHFYFTQWYPPLLPTYLGVFFVLLKPSYWSARYAILLLSLIFIALMHRVSSKLSNNEKSGLITTLLVTTSSIVWIQSVLCMEEILAMIGMLATMVVYSKVEREKSNPAWVGLCMAGTMLIRLSTGIYVAGAVFVLLMMNWLKNGKLQKKYIIRMITPFILFCIVWWGHPLKIKNLINYIQASPPAYESLGWHPIIYYWQSIVTAGAVSPWIGIVILMSLVNAIRHWRDNSWSIPLVFILATWIVLLIKQQLNFRFFIGALSCSFITTGQSLVELFDLLSASRLRRLKISIYALTFVIIAVSISFIYRRIASFPLLIEVVYETDIDSMPIYTWISKNVNKDGDIFMVNGWDQFSSAGLNFYLGMETWPQQQLPRVYDVFLVDPAEKPELVNAFHTALDSTVRSYVVHIENSPVPNSGAWWAYEPALQSCWNNGWQDETSFWIHMWDIRLEERIITNPNSYMDKTKHLITREKFWYPLFLELKVAECQN
jgi:hypothetical protein